MQRGNLKLTPDTSEAQLNTRNLTPRQSYSETVKAFRKDTAHIVDRKVRDS
jgi:hypothetical protein